MLCDNDCVIALQVIFEALTVQVCTVCTGGCRQCTNVTDASSGVARALYSYQAQSAEELSFQQGALIQLISCQRGEVCVVVWGLKI